MGMTIKVLIAEDERLAREELEFLFSQETDFTICATAENGKQVLDLYEEHHPDVLFLDIQMPGLTGMEAARVLVGKQASSSGKLPLIVFTTAYEEYALQAFGVQALDYLLKPFDTERFQQTVLRVRRQLSAQETDLEPETPLSPEQSSIESEGQSRQRTKILIHDGEKLIVVPTESIEYAVRTERAVDLYTARGRIPTRWTLQDFENKLRGLPFLRTHRSYLVNLEYIHEITPWINGAYTIVLDNEERTKIPVSRNVVKTLFRLLQQ